MYWFITRKTTPNIHSLGEKPHSNYSQQLTHMAKQNKKQTKHYTNKHNRTPQHIHTGVHTKQNHSLTWRNKTKNKQNTTLTNITEHLNTHTYRCTHKAKPLTHMAKQNKKQTKHNTNKHNRTPQHIHTGVHTKQNHPLV